jgi:Las17-binding protein actin regulator
VVSVQDLRGGHLQRAESGFDNRGLFAGVSLEGSTLRPDNKANESLYGKKLSARDIVLEGAVPSPASAENFSQRWISMARKSRPKNNASFWFGRLGHQPAHGVSKTTPQRQNHRKRLFRAGMIL